MKSPGRFVILAAAFALLAGLALPLTAQAPAAEPSQKDIDAFLGFADEYIKASAKFLSPGEGATVAECFYSDNKKQMSATESFLKKKKWTMEKMNDFLFLVGMSMEAIGYYEEYGYPEEVGTEPEDDPFNDIPRSVIELAKTNKAKLEKYFPPMELDMEGYEEPPTDTLDTDSGSDAEPASDAPLPPGPPVPPRP